MTGTTPRVCVAVATYRRPERVARLLDALAQQAVPPGFLEVVVCDDGSGPAALASLQAAAAACPLDVTVLAQRNAGPGAARNTAWRAGTAPVVAFTDDDCQPVPGWAAAVAAAAGPGRVVVGRVAPNPDQLGGLGPWSRTLRVDNARFFQAANTSYARSDLEAVGGFDVSLSRSGEDTDLGLRVVATGATAVFSPDALVHPDVRAGTVRQLARENAKWVDLPLVVRRHPQLRAGLHRPHFWKPSHPPLVAAVVGVVGATVHPAALVLALPYLKLRLVDKPMRSGRLSRVTALPGAVVVDASELLALARGSVRHRSLLL